VAVPRGAQCPRDAQTLRPLPDYDPVFDQGASRARRLHALEPGLRQGQLPEMGAQGMVRIAAQRIGLPCRGLAARTKIARMTNALDVSVVIAVKDGARTLQRCLDSIYGQRHVRAEVLVVDADSKDGTAAILRANDARLAFYVSEPDRGLYAAWNKALPRSRGEWLCFLGCDDVFHDDLALHDLVRSPAALGSAARVVYGKMNLVTLGGAVAQTVGRPWAETRGEFLSGFMIPHSGTLHHRSLFEIHGGFDESYRVAGDYEFVLRELKQAPAEFVDRVAADMQLGGRSGRPDSIHATLREVARARRAHGLTRLPVRLALALTTSWIGAGLFRIAGPEVFGAAADAYRVLRGKSKIWKA
jgi:GT2 family glycosyltransferase